MYPGRYAFIQVTQPPENLSTNFSRKTNIPILENNSNTNQQLQTKLIKLQTNWMQVRFLIEELLLFCSGGLLFGNTLSELIYQSDLSNSLKY